MEAFVYFGKWSSGTGREVWGLGKREPSRKGSRYLMLYQAGSRRGNWGFVSLGLSKEPQGVCLIVSARRMEEKTLVRQLLYPNARVTPHGVTSLTLLRLCVCKCQARVCRHLDPHGQASPGAESKVGRTAREAWSACIAPSWWPQQQLRLNTGGQVARLDAATGAEEGYLTQHQALLKGNRAHVKRSPRAPSPSPHERTQ